MAEATATTSNDCAVEMETSPKPTSPKAPVRKHRALKSEIEVKPNDNIVCKETVEECDTSEAPSPSQCSDISDKRTVKSKPEKMSPKLRSTNDNEAKKQKFVEQLQHENAALKKALEGERSALREQRAQHETEGRRERAEARRREASLEGQLRSALKGGVVGGAPPPPPHDCALAAALEATKAANKCLQKKLQVLTEADKRKAGELRTQHEAHVHQLQQLEKKARAQTAQLLEELKQKERQLSQATGRSLSKSNRSSTQGSSGTCNTKGTAKMGVAEQLHLMEGQISRLESELQRRDDIIQSLRKSKLKRDKPHDSQQFSKDSILKDTISDVDSAVSSGPNSLSPQPSPDLWFQSRDVSLGNVEEGLLETARRQIQELELALSISKASHQSAQLRATQLEEQLQDLREHADLLEFRCLELEDTSEKKNTFEEITDCDSGCTSPEICLKTSVSPPLRRSDSGYKSPTHRPSSPRAKCHRVLKTPTLSLRSNPDSINGADIINSEIIHPTEDIKDRLERILLRIPSQEDKNCLEEVLNLLWNLQTLSTSFIEDDYTMIKHKKPFDIDCLKNDFENGKASKIVATISPYSQKSFHDTSNLTKPILNNETNLLDIKNESRKLLLGLHESGIFDESDWDNKETQTDWCDFASTEPSSDLTTEVQRLNQIREELEKSGAIRCKKLDSNRSKNDSYYDKMQHLDQKHIDFYENRVTMLENKISIYESSNDIREKKLAQRLQNEIDLQAKIKILESDFKTIHEKYLKLEEEYCELEEAENDTRLQCQMLQTEFEIQSAKLRDLDEERSCARNEADCYRALVDEYENKSTYLQEQEKELKDKIKIMENAVPALVFWNIWKIIDKYPDFDFKAAYKARFDSLSLGMNSNEALQPEIVAMIDYLRENNDIDALPTFEEHLQTYGENEIIQNNYKVHEDVLRSKMSTIEKIVLENSVMCKKQEEASAHRIKALENELKSIKQNSNQKDQNKPNICDGSCKSKIQTLLDKENELKERIKALENREVVLLMTLTQADEMWANVESKYKLQIKQYEDSEIVLKEQVKECDNDKNRWKSKCEPLEQKVSELEESELKFETAISKLTQENKDLLTKIVTLENQISILRAELQQSKEQTKDMEDKHKNELMIHKKKAGVAREELMVQKKQQIDGDEVHNSKLSQVKKQLSRTAKDLQELEVTNGELKEEVETLEKEVQKLSKELSKQQTESEEQVKLLLEELTNKSKEADSLKKELEEYQRLPSAREELEQLNESIPKNINTQLSPPEVNNNTKCLTEMPKNVAINLESVNNEFDANKSHKTGETPMNREKPALPKRKPKLTSESLKFKMEHKSKLFRSKSVNDPTESSTLMKSEEERNNQLNLAYNVQNETNIKTNRVIDLQPTSNILDSATNLLTMDDIYIINKNITNTLQELSNCDNCRSKAKTYLQDSLSILQKAFKNPRDSTQCSKLNKEDKYLPWRPKPFQSILPASHIQSSQNECEQTKPLEESHSKVIEENGASILINTPASVIKDMPTLNQKQVNKSMGVFVLDRVSKLLTGINPSTQPEYSSPLSKDESKLIGKSVYIYNL